MAPFARDLRRKPGQEPQKQRSDVILRSVLVALLWVLLHFLKIPSEVAIVTLAAVFGPEALRVGAKVFSRRD
jgi:hypothetical protein